MVKASLFMKIMGIEVRISNSKIKIFQIYESKSKRLSPVFQIYKLSLYAFTSDQFTYQD